MNPALASQLQQVVRDRLKALDLERTRRDADLIRAKCQSFKQFVRHAWHVIEPSTPLKWSWHLDAICDHLEAVTRGTLPPKLIINVPPGSSKSTIVSVMWQAWEWGPLGLTGLKHLSTSYELDNATRDSRKTRDLILSDWFQELWPIRLTRVAEDDWANDQTGTRVAVAFSSITGKRGDRFVIDDPHSLDGAESEVQRDAAVRRFIEGGQNRLNDQTKSAIVIVMQRLHERDLTGAVLARELGYVHLCIPMELEIERRCVTPIWEDPRTYDGELMDPGRFPEPAVALLKKDNDYMYAGQYQQRPTPREGGMIKVGKIEFVECIEEPVIFRCRGWDIAGSTKKKSPFTAGGLLALGVSGYVYIEDMARARAEIDAAERLIVKTAHEDSERYKIKQSLPQDPGQAGKSQKLHLSNELLGLDFIFTPESGTKEDRAIPLASYINNGLVRCLKDKPDRPWNTALTNELQNFPGSAYKDQVDSLSRSFSELAKHMKKPEPKLGLPIFIRATAG